MKKISLALIMLVIIGICVPAVSAELLTDEGSNYATFDLQSVYGSDYKAVPGFRIHQIQDWQGLYYVYYKTNTISYSASNILTANPSYNQDVTLSIGSVDVGTGTAYYNALYNSAGSITGVQIWVEIDDWHPTGYIGSQKVLVKPTSGTLFNGLELSYALDVVPSANRPIGFYNDMSSNCYLLKGIHIARSHYYWENDIQINDEFISLTREFDGNKYVSTLQITSDAGYIEDTSSNNIELPYIGTGTWKVINPSGREYSGLLVSDDPATATASVTVYIKNSQTGAAIANSKIVIDALVNGEYYPVVNKTEPSGIFTITLQPTGGGQPNPDGYRLIATADGYNNPMPEINFTVTDSKKYIYCCLDPIAGGPENENNTFIDFYVRDLNANPVSGATVKFGKYTLITNSHGYTVFEVPKNTDYTYTVSKSGYGSVTGNAVIGANDRYIINAVIGPAVTPTTPTAIPTDTQTGPTPTLTAPTGEPVSNWLEWFAAHFGMILGGGVEIGKIFMWLCFTVPVGVYVGKESKAGAAGFMAGAGIVTLFFVLIGWVPIWLLVLLALIIGLLYAKVFNNPDNGGGR